MAAIVSIFSAFGLSASAGLNAYIPLLLVGLTARYTNLIRLNAPWDLLSNEWVLLVLAVLLLVEILADKIPAVNHINDAIQTVIRPTAGAILFAASAYAISDISPVLSFLCGLLVSGTVHGTKALAIRPAITATTGGLGHPLVSTLEDITATVLSILAIVIPIFLGALLCILAAWIIWLLLRSTMRTARHA
jgi:hypothetical protein